MKTPFANKKMFKIRAGECRICKEKIYELLDVHRWRIPGSKGGKYTSDNCIVICSNCHRLIHSGKIKIIGIFDSTAGKLLNYFDENGKEHFS